MVTGGGEFLLHDKKGTFTNGNKDASYLTSANHHRKTTFEELMGSPSTPPFFPRFFQGFFDGASTEKINHRG